VFSFGNTGALRMKKYLRLYCTTCNRTIDKLVDQTRFTPDKCTITLKCTGRLIPFEYRSDRQIIPTPVSGVVDWRSRFDSTISSQNTSAVTLINSACGTKGQLVVAIRLTADPGSSAKAYITFSQRADAPSDYKQYIYRFDSSFSSISGVESGLDKKTLKYSTTDTVKVLLNGVELSEGTGSADYQLYDGSSTSSVPPNTISFNTAITSSGINQVDVIVSQASQTTDTVLTFNRMIDDESRLSTGAYENISSAASFNGITWDTYYLFYYDLLNSADLTLNTILDISKVTLNSSQADLTAETALLLSAAPYSKLDRYTSIWAPLSNFDFDQKFFKYHVQNNVKVLELAEAAVESVYPPLRFQKFNVEKTIQTALSGVTDQVTVDDSLIVGPDA
jgi:hypothetical protein